MEEKKKGLGLLDLASLGTGQVIGAGIVTLVGEAIAVTGMSAWVAYPAAILVGFISILPFIFLSSTMVLKGGDYSVVNSFYDDKRIVGFFSYAFILQCLILSMLGSSLANYLVSIFPGLNKQIVALCAITIFYITNLMGVSVMAKVQNVLTVTLVICLTAFCIFGFGKVSPDTFKITSPGFFKDGPGGFMSAVALYTYSTYGQYNVINYSKDARNPKRDVPIAMLIATGLIMILYVGIAIVDCGVLPLDQVAGQPLTVVANQILGSRITVAFVIGGPLMALATTMNSTYAARVNVLVKATEDGWFPKWLAKRNRHGVPYILLTIIFLIGVIPVIFNLTIKVITSNLVLVAYFLHTVTALGIAMMPKKCPKEWAESTFHIPDKAYYAMMVLVMIAQLYMVWISLRNLPLLIAAINILFMAGCFVAANIRLKAGKMTIEKEI